LSATICPATAMARPVRHISVEFLGGPLDGWSSGQMTDEKLEFPVVMVTKGGEYRLHVGRDHRYVYRWNEAHGD
jgi:hypothetical protein